MENNVLEAALQYHKLGLSIIPVKEDKKPLIKWEKYQKVRATEEEIRVWFDKKNPPNVAIVTGILSNLTVVDTDSKEATEKIQALLPEALTLPIAKTPKDGRHFFFKYHPGSVNRARVDESIDIRSEGGYVVAAPSINGNGKSWEWVISLLDADPIEMVLSISTIIKDSFNYSLYRESLTSEVPITNDKSAEVSGSQRKSDYFSEGRRDEDLFSTANSMIKGNIERGLADYVLNIIVNSWGENDPKWVRDKINSAIKRVERKDRNIAGEFRDWIKEVSSGQFKVSEYQKESAIVSKQDKHTLIVAAKKLCVDGILEKVGKRTGEYRIIDKDIEYMDFVNVSKDGSIPLTLPLDIHKKTIFFPRNVIVVAGVTGYGKTTYLLNVIRDNGHKFRFKYFASEMSELALNYKLASFRCPVEHWQKWMDVIPDYKWDCYNIQDKIFPNDMNVIDYLEPEGEKTYNIHDIITKIIKRLDKGMALIATQKKQGSDLSAGGVYSAKAASLYLSMDWGTIFIFKNRFREEDLTPKMTRKDFEIQTGQSFVETSDWYDPTEKKKKEKNYAGFDKD